MLDPNKKAVDYGFDKVLTFATVNKGSTMREKSDRLDLLAQSVGIKPDVFEHVITRSAKLFEHDCGFLITGVLIGMFMAEHALEHKDPLL